MKLATRSLLLPQRRRYFGVVVATVALVALIICNGQHQAEAFSSSSSPLLGIRPSTSWTTVNSRVGHDGRSPWNDDYKNNSSLRPSRTFLSVSSRPVVNVDVDRTKAGEQLKTQSTDTDIDISAETRITLDDDSDSDSDKRMGAERDEHENDRIAKEEFQKGFRIIGFITLLNASLAPVWCVL